MNQRKNKGGNEREHERENARKKRESVRARESKMKRDTARARARERERDKGTQGERDFRKNLMLIDGLVYRHYLVLLLLHSSCTESKGEKDLSD